MNRFGLGAQGVQSAPDRPRVWLLDQLSEFDPAPRPIAARPTGADAAKDFLAYRAAQRNARRGQRDLTSLEDASDGLRQVLRGYFRGARQSYIADVGARAQAAVESNAPFVERMVHFWSNHFTVSVAKRQASAFAGPYEFGAIRPHVLGKFGDMLRATALHPAMLLYLDQLQSVGPNSVGARFRNGRRRDPNQNQVGLNENLAREIFELHTLGVDGGYAQSDVTEFARALTGFTLAGLPFLRNAIELGNGVAFADLVHEPGSRTIMGQTYRQSGGEQALAILSDLSRHPATARHIATKLARHFSSDDPPPSLVTRLETVFLETDGDLPSLYRTLIEAPEPWQNGAMKFRTPWEWSIASLRATGTTGINPRIFTGMQSELGQVVWGAPSPAGYPDLAKDWAAPDALVRRIEVAARIAGNARPSSVPTLARNLFPDSLGEPTATAIARAESPRQGLALLLSSPEMMRR
ncbi:DUF1800 family protein [Erythrobacter jejuensis]|uniref:DUF1800 family protein n=1 Tax=Parerythrobacter jejuensis TaxID=795812 RepID=A0A845AM77_9SPHN|nr:DUF1800 family protein [Parerythrobacter jejuensis]